uniref:Hapless 2 n=1 Tax=Macrostomum lignano TaxID=282301 RepID=A0A1I8J937_9PLAT
EGANPEIAVHVSITGVNLVPVYKDGNKTLGLGGRQVDASDNAFIAKYLAKRDEHTSSGAGRWSAKLRDVHAKQPIPDHYVLQLTRRSNILNRVQRISCANRKNLSPTSDRCPADYGPDEQYYVRRLNSPCSRQNYEFIRFSEFGEYNPYRVGSEDQIGFYMEPNLNKFYCGQTTELLARVFNMTNFEELTPPIFADDCAHAAAKCLACQNQKEDKCQQPGLGVSCCKLECFSSLACSSFYRETCMKVEPVCARGDVDRFVLTPTFDGFSHANRTYFLCHVTYEPPDQLYSIGYNVSLAGDGDAAEWRGDTLWQRVPSANASFHRRGSVDFGPLRVTHDAEIDLPQDYIVHGSLWQQRQRTMANLTVHQLRSDTEPMNGTIRVETPLSGSPYYTAVVQVRRPFDVSSANWLSHHCHMNSSLLTPADKIYADKGQLIDQEMPVAKDGVFYYTLQSGYLAIEIQIPEGQSLLRHYFCRDAPSPRLASSAGSLTYSGDGLWTINITVSPESEAETERCSLVVRCSRDERVRPDTWYLTASVPDSFGTVANSAYADSCSVPTSQEMMPSSICSQTALPHIHALHLRLGRLPADPSGVLDFSFAIPPAPIKKRPSVTAAATGEAAVPGRLISRPLGPSSVTSTPAYVRLQLKDIGRRRLLLVQEWLIRQLSFSAVLTLPLLGPDATSGSDHGGSGGRDLPGDADLEADLDDCAGSRVGVRRWRRRIAAAAAAAAASEEANWGGSGRRRVLFGAGGMVPLVLCVLLGLLYLFLLVTFLLVRSCRSGRSRSGRDSVQRHQQLSTPAPVATCSQWRRRLIVAVYLTVRVCYCLLFTFSAGAALLMAMRPAEFARLERGGRGGGSGGDEVSYASFSSELEHLETLSGAVQAGQLQHLQEMRHACDRVLAANLADLGAAFGRSADAQARLAFDGDRSVGRLLGERFVAEHRKFANRLSGFLDVQLQELSDRLELKYSPYAKYLKEVYGNKWMSFPLSIYNRTHFLTESLYDFYQRKSHLRKREVDFMSFLEDTNAEELHLMPTVLWKRFGQMLPQFSDPAFYPPAAAVAAAAASPELPSTGSTATSGHCLALLCGLTAALCLLLVLAVCERAALAFSASSAPPPTPTGALSTAQLTSSSALQQRQLLTATRPTRPLLAELAEQAGRLASAQATLLNGPGFAGAFKLEARVEVARLMQLVSRFNYDQ